MGVNDRLGVADVAAGVERGAEVTAEQIL